MAVLMMVAVFDIVAALRTVAVFGIVAVFDTGGCI